MIKVAGICGATPQACREAEAAVAAGWQIGLVSLAALKDALTAAQRRVARGLGFRVP